MSETKRSFEHLSVLGLQPPHECGSIKNKGLIIGYTLGLLFVQVRAVPQCMTM